MKTLCSVLKIGGADSADIDQTKRSLYQRHVCLFFFCNPCARAWQEDSTVHLYSLHLSRRFSNFQGRRDAKETKGKYRSYT